ncbi:MAG: cytochrome b/b6 domain-containing protein [Silicimonas sp.]|nr:cytochrome b/b6 domain-containing protein [Silicimonas sp.]
MSEKTGFTLTQIALHWAVAFLIIAAFVTHDGMGRALEARIESGTTGMEGATLHTIFGGMAFALILIRVIVRLRQGAPTPHGSPLVVAAATWGHRVLYLLMLMVPAMGAATWYGHIEPLGDPHEILGKALMIVALGHALVALAHHFLLKDGTLTKMLKPET